MAEKTYNSQTDIFENVFEEGEENENELNVDYLDKIQETVTWSSDWTVETIFSQIKKGLIDLSPPFQRRDAWNISKKSKLIESILLGFPIPQIVLAEDKRNKGKFIVVDGKQRLTSISLFLSDKFKLNLPKNKILHGKTFSGLLTDSPEYMNVFLNQNIRSVILKNWPTENFLFMIFYRLNTGSLPLSPQELRRALKPGHLIDSIIAYAENSEAIKKIFKSKHPDPRMKDVELILRYISFEEKIGEYDGDFKTFLDQTCDLFDKDWATMSKKFNFLCEKFESVVDLCYSIFGENAFKKKSKDGYETRFNRAVFDIQTFYLGSPKIIQVAKQNAGSVVEAFDSLCIENTSFNRSITVNTLNIMNFSTRHAIFGAKMEEIFNVPGLVPAHLLELYQTKFKE